MKQLWERLWRWLNADTLMGVVLVLALIIVVLLIYIDFPWWVALALFALFVATVLYVWREGDK